MCETPAFATPLVILQARQTANTALLNIFLILERKNTFFQTDEIKSTPMPQHPSLRLREATSADIHDLAAVFHRAFTAPFWTQNFGDTPNARRWWADWFAIAIERDPAVTVLVVEDVDVNSNKNKIVAFAKWVHPQ